MERARLANLKKSLEIKRKSATRGKKRKQALYSSTLGRIKKSGQK